MLDVLATTGGYHPGLYSITCFVMALLIAFLTGVIARAWPAIERTYTSFVKGVLRQIVQKHAHGGTPHSTANTYGGRQFSTNNSNPQNSVHSNPSSNNNSSSNPSVNNSSQNSNREDPSSNNGEESSGVPDTNGANANGQNAGRFKSGSGDGNGVSGKPGNGTSGAPGSSTASSGKPGNSTSGTNGNNGKANAIKNALNGNNGIAGQTGRGLGGANGSRGGNHITANSSQNAGSPKDQAIKDNGQQPQGFGAILGNKAKNGAAAGLKNVGSKIGNAAKHPGATLGKAGNALHKPAGAAKKLGHAVTHPADAAAGVLGHPGQSAKSLGRGLGNVATHAANGAGRIGKGIGQGANAINQARDQAAAQQVNGLGSNMNDGQLSTAGAVTNPEAADYGREADNLLNQAGNISNNSNPLAQSTSNSHSGGMLGDGPNPPAGAVDGTTPPPGAQSSYNPNSARNAILRKGLNNNHGNHNSHITHGLNNSKQINSSRINNGRRGGKLSKSNQMKSLSSKAGSMHHINMPRTMQQASRNIQSALGQHRSAQAAASQLHNTPNVSLSQQQASASRVKSANHNLRNARLGASMVYESRPTNRNLVNMAAHKIPTNREARQALSNVFHAQNKLTTASKSHVAPKAMMSIGHNLKTATDHAKSIGLKPASFSTRPQVVKSMKTLNTGLSQVISGRSRPIPKAPKLKLSPKQLSK